MLLKSIPALLLALPMLAQSSWIAGRIGHRESSSFLLYIGGLGDSFFQELQTLLRTDELLEMDIELGFMRATSPDYARLVRELRLGQDILWVLTDNRGRALLQGNKIPNPADMRSALDAAGAKSPIRVLRDFLRQRPDHLEARLHLVERLRRIAESRTRNILQLGMKSVNNLDPNNPSFWSRDMSVIDTSALEGKLLNPEDDIKIWGPYAHELQTIFSSDDWRLMPISRVQGQIPFEVCSPTMIQIYHRHNAMIEAYLEELPSNYILWHYYAWTQAITGQTSARALLDRLLPVPVPAPGSIWPTSEALSLLISQERAKGNWGFIAETLMSNRHRFRFAVIDASRQFGSQPELEPWQTAFLKGELDKVWRSYLSPLLESLIKTNRISDAEAIIIDMASHPVQKDIQYKAADLALSSDRKDLSTKWLALQIPEKTDEMMYDLDWFYSNSGPASGNTLLAVINAEEPDFYQVYTMLGQGRINDWGIIPNSFKPAIDLIRRKENWPEGIKYWGLLDYKKNVIAHGPGLPTEEALYQALVQYSVETPANILRRFIREHPSHLEAKLRLLSLLKSLAENKSREKFGEDAGLDANRVLTDEDDQAIWGEYDSLYRQMLPYCLNQGRPPDMAYPNVFESNYFIHSKIMKNLANWMLPQVEASIRRQPTDNEFLWSVWVFLSDLIERPRLFRNLMETLALSPMSNPLNVLPINSRNLLLGRYQASKNWQGIIDVLESSWSILWERSKDSILASKDIANNWWERETRYLLEASLHLGKDTEANIYVELLSQTAAWGQIKQSAIDLAEKCGKTALAKQWKSL